MPSFDVVSKVNPMEIENAINQANKEFQRIFAENPDFRDVAQRLNELSMR